ncbi:MAG: copper amine oxidase N-terminal domain-containing protein [Desulfotomaculaceae bacterium]|nr:copper amine oxidase N-terminal domain-containing protein [Desulfotomaculaceae bacterium]
MRKSLFFVVMLALMTVVLVSPAFAAGEVQLQVNGDMVPSPILYLDNDVTMISADTYARLSGADFSEAGNDFTITENGNILSLTNGKNEAMLGDQAVELPRAPLKTDDVVYVPLRAVSSAFGFEVGWDTEKWLVSLVRDETRDGMTPFDLLAKSTAASQAYNTYSMDGTYDMDMEMMVDGKLVEDAPQNLATTLTGQIQNDPIQLYMIQKVNANEAGQIPEMVIEMYMDGEKMFMKMPDQDWLAMDLPFSPEFWKEQQDIQSDPLKAISQMKEMGILVNYGNDTTVNGQDYYVVNASLDIDKFMENFQEMFQSAMQATSSGEAQENPADMQQQMQKIMENAQLDYFYKILINKETLISDIIKFNAKMDLTMENPEPDTTQSGEQAAQEMSMKFDINGEFTIGGLGEPFKAPVIDNNVKNMEQTQVTP